MVAVKSVIVILFSVLPIAFAYSKNAAKFLGKWQLTESENFDAYMEAAGVSFFARLFGNSARPLLTVSVNEADEKWSVVSETLLKTVRMDFYMDQEFDETTADGRVMKSTFTLRKDGKLIQEQKKISPADKDSLFTRYVEGDKLIVICESGGVVAKRTYTKVA